MSIRSEGRQLAASVTVLVGVVSLAATGIVSLALWLGTVRTPTSVGTSNVQRGDGSDTNQSGFSDDGSQQQIGPAVPGQGFGQHAQSSGS
ncbi:hypothetical protein [Lacisediminihabitans profunda]|uniref:Uncharacterized protein n=1 Tax=Lacisediminihabitans profunda TaxID=2594790 RepID=A0A5C8UR37_9MICO|nr:hypothetical protein [Lacisediminihabitans profunda]TXN30694.1 hypothetical protein FVP33_09290 [Lacisediminihabitans profunda]